MAFPSVAVIGSLNIDFITRTTRLPAGGETLAALSFDTGFGGKGANQAVAGARLAGNPQHTNRRRQQQQQRQQQKALKPGNPNVATGDEVPAAIDDTAAPDVVRVRMVGHVGDDGFGNDYLGALGKEGIDSAGVRQLAGKKTGVTNIIVEQDSGENRILFVPNANHEFTPKWESASWDLISSDANPKEVVVFQLEIPTAVVLRNLQLAHNLGQHTILNPAPAVPLPREVYPNIHTLIMNETEAGILSEATASANLGKGTTAQETYLPLAHEFLSRGVRDSVIITLGAQGLVYATTRGTQGYIAARRVAAVVDTTAAGDTFVGGYAVQVARWRAGTEGNFEHEKALEFATLAASKTVEREGAMAAIPFWDELEG